MLWPPIHIARPGRKRKGEAKLIVPHMLRVADILPYLTGMGKPHHSELTSQQRHYDSLDVVIRGFRDMEGKHLGYPAIIRPGQRVIGGAVMGIRGERIAQRFGKGTTLCVDSRYRHSAYRGLVCTGFYYRGGTYPYINGTKKYARNIPNLVFSFVNVSPHTYMVKLPLALVQLFAVVPIGMPIDTKLPIGLKEGGVDVTEQCYTMLGDVPAYRLSSGPEIQVMTRLGRPVPFTDDDTIQGSLQPASVDDIVDQRLPFCLTETAQELVTHGCPIFVFPFSYATASSRSGLMHPRNVHRLVDPLFTKKQVVSATANAGLLHAGSSGPVMLQHAFPHPKKRRFPLEDHLRPGEPTALAIPVPFYDNGPGVEYSVNPDQHRLGIKD